MEYYYWAERHASANPDLTRVLFTTNWGRFDTGEVEVFMIALPPDWPERLPTSVRSSAIRLSSSKSEAHSKPSVEP